MRRGEWRGGEEIERITNSSCRHTPLKISRASAIVDPALKLMIGTVQRYDGYVVQSTGDGIFALFGAPVAHEDHPQRALYAALRMQEEMRRYSSRLREAGNLPLEARVGVNTGEVVVRTISTGATKTEYTPIGHTANLASRMQALAPTGSIAVSDNTRRLIEGYFALKPLGPTSRRWARPNTSSNTRRKQLHERIAKALLEELSA
jgi:class 3 adenylate cyclase